MPPRTASTTDSCAHASFSLKSERFHRVHNLTHKGRINLLTFEDVAALSMI
jgi:hypothetical protein